MYFIDRSLGKRVIAGRLRAVKWTVVTMEEFYDSEDIAQNVSDVKWIADVAQAGLPALTCDSNIRRVPEERQTVVEYGLRVFMLPRANMTGPEQAERYDNHRASIDARASSDDRGYIDVVYEDRVERRYPAPDDIEGHENDDEADD